MVIIWLLTEAKLALPPRWWGFDYWSLSEQLKYKLRNHCLINAWILCIKFYWVLVTKIPKISHVQCREPEIDFTAAQTDKFLDCNEPRDFRISWNGGIIHVGQGKDLGWNEFLSYAPATPLEISHILVSTGRQGDKGIWNINPCNMPSGMNIHY